MLFGDAGFAAIVGRDPTATPWFFESASIPSQAISIPHDGYFQMQGTEVFNFSISAVPQQIQTLLADTSLAHPNLYLLHQANAFILQQIARMCRLDPAVVPCRMKQRGNTSVASLPLLMCDLAAEGYVGAKTVVLAAFGVGLTTLAAHLQLDFDNVLPTFTIE
jgi:3-oxoacyl-[acyl-carrier-protein] synthase-3